MRKGNEKIRYELFTTNAQCTLRIDQFPSNKYWTQFEACDSLPLFTE